MDCVTIQWAEMRWSTLRLSLPGNSQSPLVSLPLRILVASLKVIRLIAPQKMSLANGVAFFLPLDSCSKRIHLPDAIGPLAAVLSQVI